MSIAAIFVGFLVLCAALGIVLAGFGIYSLVVFRDSHMLDLNMFTIFSGFGVTTLMGVIYFLFKHGLV
jgi:hypothetical protein